MKIFFALIALFTSTVQAAEIRCERIGLSLENTYLTEHSLLEGVIFLASGKAEHYGFRHRLWNAESGVMIKQVGIQASESGEMHCTEFSANSISLNCSAGPEQYSSYIKLSQAIDRRLVLEMQTIRGSTYTWFNPGECTIK